MERIEERVVLREERARLFGFVTSPDHFPEYVAGYAGGCVTSERPTGLGSAFEWRAKLGPLGLDATERVVEWQPPDKVVYAGRMAGVDFRSAMILDEAAGGTELKVAIDYSVPRGRGGRMAERVIGPLIKADVKASLARLRTRFGESGDTPSEAEVIEIYRKRAARYDQATHLYRLAGFRLDRYRCMVADATALRPGDTVVEIGCGTGANFPFLQERIGPAGRLIGVDLTDAMLERAARRVRRAAWRNVELVQTDAAKAELPKGTNAIVSTLALTLCPDYDAVIERGARALAPGGRWVLLDLKMPEWPDWLVRVALAAARPYAVTLGSATRHPWESLERHLPQTRLRELYFGAAYLAVGIAPGERSAE